MSHTQYGVLINGAGCVSTQHADAAARAGKHLMTEKSVANSLEELERMELAAETRCGKRQQSM